MNAAVHTSTSVHRCRDDVPATLAIYLTIPSGGRSCAVRHSVPGWPDECEEIGEQLVDALGTLAKLAALTDPSVVLIAASLGLCQG